MRPYENTVLKDQEYWQEFYDLSLKTLRAHPSLENLFCANPSLSNFVTWAENTFLGILFSEGGGFDFQNPRPFTNGASEFWTKK